MIQWYLPSSGPPASRGPIFAAFCRRIAALLTAGVVLSVGIPNAAPPTALGKSTHISAIAYIHGEGEYEWFVMEHAPGSARPRYVRLMRPWYGPYIDDHAFSADGRWFAFSARGSGRDYYLGRGNLHLTDCRTGRSWQITRDFVGYRQLRFSPDGRWLAYYRIDKYLQPSWPKTPDREVSVWALNTETRRKHRLLTCSLSRFAGVQWVAQGVALAVGGTLYRWTRASWTRTHFRMRDGSTWPFRINGRLILREARDIAGAERAYYVLPQNSGDYSRPSTWRFLGTVRMPVRSDVGELSSDLRQVLSVVPAGTHHRIIVWDAHSNTVRSIADTQWSRLDRRVRWSADGRHILALKLPPIDETGVPAIVAYRVDGAKAVPAATVDWSAPGRVPARTLLNLDRRKVNQLAWFEATRPLK